MGITQGQFGPQEGEETAVLGCYTPNDPDLPVVSMYAHYLVKTGDADLLLGYSLDGIRPDPFTINLATFVPGGGVWAVGECVCYIPDPINRVVMDTFGSLGFGALSPPVIINAVGATFDAVFLFDIGRGIQVPVTIHGEQLSGPGGPMFMNPSGILIFPTSGQEWRMTFECEWAIDWQMAVASIEPFEVFAFDPGIDPPATQYIQNAGIPITLPFNGLWNNGGSITASYFGWSDLKSVSWRIRTVNNGTVMPGIMTRPDLTFTDCDCICADTNTAEIYNDCGDVPGATVPTGINLLANGEMSAGIGFGQFSIFGAGWRTEYVLPILTNNILPTPGTIANFTTNMFQVATFPPALNVPALDGHSVAVNIDNFSGSAVFIWDNVALTLNETYQFVGDMARLLAPSFVQLDVYNASNALVFSVQLNGPGLTAIWQNVATEFLFPAPSGFYRVELIGTIGGAANQVLAFDNLALREADLQTRANPTDVGYPKTVRAVIDQIVETSGCNDDRRDDLNAAILQRLSAPCGDPILTASTNMAAEVMCDYGNQNDPYAAPILNIFPGGGVTVPPFQFLQFDAAGPDFLSPVEINPYTVGPSIQLLISGAPTAHMIWAGDGKHLHILTGTNANRLNSIRTYDPITLQAVDVFLTGTAFGAPIETVINGVDFGFCAIGYDPADGQVWGLAQGPYAPLGPNVASQWWLINPVTGVCTYHSEAPAPFIGGGPAFSNGSFVITTDSRWFYSSGAAPQDITGLTHASEIAPHGSLAIAPLPFLTFPPSPNYYGLKMAAAPNGTLLVTIQDGFSGEELYWMDPTTPVTPTLIEGPAPAGFQDRVWAYSPFKTVPNNFPGVGDDTPFQFVRTWEQDCDGTFNPVDRTMDGEIYLPVGPVGKCSSGSESIYTSTECLTYTTPPVVNGYISNDTLRNVAGVVQMVVPGVSDPFTAADQNHKTGLVYFFTIVPYQMTVVDPVANVVVATVPLIGGPVPSLWTGAAYNPTTDEFWIFGSQGTGFSEDAYKVTLTTGVISYVWSTPENMPITIIEGGAGFSPDGRLYMRDLVNPNNIVERDQFTGLIIQNLNGPIGMWTDHYGMDFDDSGLMYANNGTTNQIDVYQITNGSPGSFALVGTFGGFVNPVAFGLLREPGQGPFGVTRYFHKNLETDVVTTQDHDPITGAPVTIPDNATIRLCSDPVEDGVSSGPRYKTEVIDIPASSSGGFAPLPGLVSWTIRNRANIDASGNTVTVNLNPFLLDAFETISSGGVNQEDSLLTDTVTIVTGAFAGVRITLLRRV